ncbi:hypothetical protein BDF20DRAFT_881486 [Mycotypha africana]|uniref:uncharacterized protein n=1 Tax=Mycotypha africana TaxID=64632 RepID=UPI0022FFE3B9|nr:uncharacterized protein BDF20DRAFT_881486 [Mycotypha africana]KAI8973275.1 hypothetical protein BDF20DRAFT_881486 [Mycotypha africana]
MAKEKSTKKAPTKKVSPYNNFMKTELAKVKEANPGIAHKEAFKLAAQNWSKAPENPKNKKDDKKDDKKEEEKKD